MKLQHRLATLVGLAVGLAGVALVPIAAAASAPVVAGSAPQPAAPAQAQVQIGAAAPAASGSTTRRASAQEALSAASLPGATVAVAPGLSPAQAVGLSPVVSPAVSTPAVSTPSSTPTAAVPIVRPVGTTIAATACFANAQWTEWGIWPYQQRITDTTYWCAIYGDHITYTSSNTSGTGTLCGTSWTSSQIISGGAGYSWFVNRASAGFSCPTAIPWISLHPSHYEDTSRNDWGSTQWVGTN